MKFSLSALFLLASNVLPSNAHSRASGPMRFPFEIMRASANVDKAIEMYAKGSTGGAEQPSCADNRFNFVEILDIPADFDDVTFLAHPFVPIGTTFGLMKGSPSYDSGKAMYDALVASVSADTCEADGIAGLAFYDWVGSERFVATALVKKFKGPEGNMLLVATGPLNEPLEGVEEEEDISMVDSFKMMKAAESLETAIADFESGTEQPVCSHPTKDYIFCVSVPEDIDEVAFHVHPLVPVGTKLADLKGTSDYDLGKGMVEAVVDAVTIPDCDATGNYGLATYGWLHSDDYTTAVMATSLVKDFTHEETGERFICGTNPLVEMTMSKMTAKEAERAPEEEEETTLLDKRISLVENVCDGKKPVEGNENRACLIDSVVQVTEQAGGNVTVGYKGLMDVGDRKPLTNPFWMEGMCPVNVHWHTGTEHLSMGEFDEAGSGPFDPRDGDGERLGFQCHHYDETDSKFTTPYDWKYCEDMKVGQTYEIHWPHSAAGACGTPNQYQTPFYDGLFCNDGIISATNTMDTIGVQAQVFTVVNDEDYYYPNLMRGMVVQDDMGKDVTKYTGSSTGTTRNNELCSMYTPITWQVDRKCHMVSASSFDKMCAEMLTQNDDLSSDTDPHGARELTLGILTANNQHNRLK